MKDLINEICYCLITGVRIIQFQMIISLAQFCTESKEYLFILALNCGIVLRTVGKPCCFLIFSKPLSDILDSK